MSGRPEVSFFVERPAFWRRDAVIAQVGDNFEVIARFWWADKADDLVDRLSSLMWPVWCEELGSSDD